MLKCQQLLSVYHLLDPSVLKQYHIYILVFCLDFEHLELHDQLS